MEEHIIISKITLNILGPSAAIVEGVLIHLKEVGEKDERGEWVRCTAEDVHKIIPSMSEVNIRRCIKKLRDFGIIYMEKRKFKPSDSANWILR